MSNATKLKILTILGGVFERARKVHKLPRNPMSAVEKPIQRVRGDIDVFSVEEVMALVRAADDEQDAAIYLTAALTGLRRGEVVALPWSDVDFAGQSIRVRASYTEGGLTTGGGGYLDASALYRRYKCALEIAGLRPRAFTTCATRSEPLEHRPREAHVSADLQARQRAGANALVDPAGPDRQQLRRLLGLEQRLGE